MDAQIMREYLPFMPGWTPYLMYAFVILVAGILVWETKRKLENYGLSVSELINELKYAFKHRRKEIGRRLADQVLGQKKVRRMRDSGIMHMAIFYSMILLFFGTFLVFLEQDILRHFGVQSLIKGNFYLIYEAVLDLAGLLLIAGLGMAWYRRLIAKPSHVHSTWHNHFILGGLLFVAVTGFVMEGIRLTLHPVPWGGFSFVGHAISALFTDVPSSKLATVYQMIWWSHLVVVMLLFVILPVSVLKHLVLIPLNLVLQPDGKAKAKMTTPFKITELEEADGEEELEIGIACADDLDWKQKLNLAACINCGRCESVCPAHASGRELSPRLLVQKVKNSFDRIAVNAEAQKENYFAAGVLSENEVWSCTNCGACVEECPASIHHVDLIIDLRRHLVAQNKLDNQKIALFNNLDQNFNPLGLPSYKRNDWLAEMNVPLLENHPTAEYLYWIGDLGSYDPRVQNVVKSVIGILQAAGVDFAVLTHEEKNCGEVLKRMGEEGRFQLLAMENIETLTAYGVRKIITHDPHTYSIVKHEYPEFEGHFEVIHHSVFINQLLKEKRIAVNTTTKEKIVFHDSCNLSRWNGIAEEPRSALSHVMENPLLEIEESRERTFCCGAGGGNYWYKVPEKEKISSIRLNQLTVAEPETIALGCPYCLMMLEDAARTSDRDVKIRDLAEIIFENIEKQAG